MKAYSSFTGNFQPHSLLALRPTGLSALCSPYSKGNSLNIHRTLSSERIGNKPDKNIRLTLRPDPTQDLFSSSDLFSISDIKNEEGLTGMKDKNQFYQIIDDLYDKNQYHYSVDKVSQQADPSSLTSLNQMFIFQGELEHKDYEKLFDFIKHHIVHRIPDVSKTIVPGEAISQYFLTNLNQLLLIYTLTSSFISGFKDMIDDDFIGGVLYMYNSPSDQEKNAAKELISTISEMYPEFNIKIFKEMTHSIERFSNGYYNQFCITPILEFMYKFFQTLKNPVAPIYFHYFRTTLYPLMKSFYLPDFYFNLIPIARFFHQKDSTTTLWCARYIFKYWPLSSSQKQVIFLHQLQCVLAILNANFFNVLASAIFLKLKLCIESANYKVAVAGVTICKDENFVKLVSKLNKSMAAEILPVLDRAKCHWHSEVRKGADDAYMMIRAKQPKNMILPPLKPEKRISKNWLFIVRLAATNYKQLDQDELKTQVMKNWNDILCY